MNKNLFAGLEDLGIDGTVTDDIDLFKKTEENVEDINPIKIELSEIQRQKAYIFDKNVTCPVCADDFKVKMVKISAARVKKKDTDFYIKYDVINPYFYDVWICTHCGYASMKADFPKIKDHQKVLISSKVTTKWSGKIYPEVYDVNIAIERYKLSLYNSVVLNTSSSRKAMTCLKIAWMYRMADDKDSEILFISQAIEGFDDAFLNESTPIYGMDDGTLMYLIGELYRRVDNFEAANIWFSKLVTSNTAEHKIKEMARTQRDFIKETEAAIKRAQLDEDEGEDKPKSTKKGFFSRFFK